MINHLSHVRLDIKQIFHALLFDDNTWNYSPEVRNIQRREAVLNITLLRAKNFDIKQKYGMEYLFHYISQAPNKKWMNGNKAQIIPVTP